MCGASVGPRCWLRPEKLINIYICQLRKCGALCGFSCWFLVSLTTNVSLKYITDRWTVQGLILHLYKKNQKMNKGWAFREPPLLPVSLRWINSPLLACALSLEKAGKTFVFFHTVYTQAQKLWHLRFVLFLNILYCLFQFSLPTAVHRLGWVKLWPCVMRA